MGDELPALVQLLSSLTGDGVARTVLGSFGFALLCGLLGAVIGLVLAITVSGPSLRWGLGRAGVWGCLATALLVLSGLLGFGWAGAWVGGGRAAVSLVHDRLVVEELALRAVVTGVSDGEHTSVDELEARLSEAFESSDDVIGEVVADIRAELRNADRDGELEQLLPWPLVEETLSRIRDDGLANPSMLARVSAAGGFRAAMSTDDPEVRAYALRLVEATAQMRAEIERMIDAAVWSTALPGAVVGVLLPLGFILLVAALGRWWRHPARV